MDHLLMPRNKAGFPRFKVPHLCTEPYDDGPVSEYPERQGWELTMQSKDTQHPFLRNNVPPESVSEVIAFFQNWFYFGLLHEFLGTLPGFSYSSFVNSINGQEYINTAALEGLVRLWTTRLIESPDREDMKKEIQKLARVMCIMGNKMTSHVVWKGDADENYLFSKSEDVKNILLVMISVTFLAEYFTAALSLVGKAIGLSMGGQLFTRWEYGWGDLMRLPFLETLSITGWCPTDVLMIKKRYNSLSVLCYLSALDPPRPGKNHSTCTAGFCNFMQVSENDYRLTHGDNICACNLLSVAPSQVESILRSGNFPLITVPPEGETLSLFESGDDIEYVAISHIWAEGKGNPGGNALHECLLHTLQHMVNALPRSKPEEPMPFWIDTLSVPIGPTKMREMAIRKMREIYQKAKHVLVLDGYLQSLNIHDLGVTTNGETDTNGAIEIFTRVFRAGWLRRLWTLQEGSLAKKLWFQFADRAIDLNELFAVAIQGQTTPMTMSASYIMKSYVYLEWNGAMYHPASLEWVDATNAGRDSHWNVCILRKSFVERETSRPEDEGLCLFCRAGLDMEEVCRVDAKERMQLFWTKIRKAPASILFAQVPQRMRQKGLGWAPTSFLPPVSNGSDWWDPEVTIGEGDIDPLNSARGLRVTLPGFVFSHLQVNPAEPPDKFLSEASVWFEFRDTHGVWYNVCGEGKEGVWWRDRWRDETFSLPTPRKMALILGTEVSGLGDDFKKGLWALVEAIDGGSTQVNTTVFHATPFMHVQIRRAQDFVQELYTIYRICAQQVQNQKRNVSNGFGSTKEYMEEVIRTRMDEIEAIYRGPTNKFPNKSLDSIRKQFVEGVENFLTLENNNEAERLHKEQVWYVD